MISSIEIKGFKSIRNQIVPLKQLNVLIGGNGVGKSNFISVFSLVRNLYEGSLQNYVIKKGGSNSFLYGGNKITNEIFIKFIFSNQIDEVINSFFVTLESGANKLFIKKLSTGFKGLNGHWHEKDFEQNIEESAFSKIKESQAYYVNNLLKEFEVYHFHDTSDNSPMKRFSSINDNRFLKKDGSNLAAFLYYLKLKHPKHFLRIERTICSIAPFFDKFILEPNRLNPENIQLEWLEKGNYESFFNANNLSDGTLRFICLTTLLLQPTPPKIIIIDEPELGLHPLAINILSELFKKKSQEGIQVIISTQSITLLNNFEPEDTIVADRKENSTIFNRLNKNELEAWTEQYSMGELWEKNIIGGQPF
ncbi:AAA family ATPase [Arachidicoccus ginsenosidivorans]|uniref:AAA family ATPase n=1 Tax=Arachidicoccus ginsenosidivorans TaxID=496057 RepID=A0A5B8VQB0_9BACT|nr:AAA family ATPase [Arachidicoccus ginsenosidivorans]QEC73433.1 AAA family ATPase [Arachidicoccus ginsenosidivorans]